MKHTNKISVPVPVPFNVHSLASLLAKARDISLEELVTGLLKAEIRASKRELDTFTVEELASAELLGLVETFRKNDGEF